MTSATAGATKTVFEGICKETVELLGLQDQIHITADSSFVVDFGADSLDTAELSMAIEDHFLIEPEASEWEHVLRVGDAVALVHKHLLASGRNMPLGVDLTNMGEAQREGTDWQAVQTEDRGRTILVRDLKRRPGEAVCEVRVTGQGAEALAQRIAEFLQSERL